MAQLSPQTVLARSTRPPTWVLYGHLVTPDGIRVALHKENLPNEGEAKKHVVIAKIGGGEVVGVVVKLDHGHDTNGQRHVVHRINNGKAWWE